jgi:hypothetical protein
LKSCPCLCHTPLGAPLHQSGKCIACDFNGNCSHPGSSSQAGIHTANGVAAMTSCSACGAILNFRLRSWAEVESLAKPKFSGNPDAPLIREAQEKEWLRTERQFRDDLIALSEQLHERGGADG